VLQTCRVCVVVPTVFALHELRSGGELVLLVYFASRVRVSVYVGKAEGNLTAVICCYLLMVMVL